MGAFVASHATVGSGGLDAVRAKQWFDDVAGNFTGLLLKVSNDQIRTMLPRFDVGTSWTYYPLPVLSTLKTPMLWTLTEDDSKAPPAAARQRLANLSSQGRPITVLEYPNADHGMIRFATGPGGRRTALGSPLGYFHAVLDWARTGQLAGAYGDGRLSVRATSKGSSVIR